VRVKNFFEEGRVANRKWWQVCREEFVKCGTHIGTSKMIDHEGVINLYQEYFYTILGRVYSPGIIFCIMHIVCKSFEGVYKSSSI